MRYTGTLEREDLEGGTWTLRTRDGNRYTLYGDVPNHLAGGEVEVEGDAEEAFGIGMAGPAITVKQVKKG